MTTKNKRTRKKEVKDYSPATTAVIEEVRDIKILIIDPGGEYADEITAALICLGAEENSIIPIIGNTSAFPGEEFRGISLDTLIAQVDDGDVGLVLSPYHLGTNESDGSDIQVMCDALGKPFIGMEPNITPAHSQARTSKQSRHDFANVNWHDRILLPELEAVQSLSEKIQEAFGRYRMEKMSGLS